jgi:O-antigen/teichoic acid export membrane protein
MTAPAPAPALSGGGSDVLVFPRPRRTARHRRQTRWTRWAMGSNAVPRSKRLTAARQRVMTLTIVDQVASSISNFALAFLIAHYGNAHVIGVFAVLTATYTLTQGLVRGMTSDCLLTRHESDDGRMVSYERGGFSSALTYASGLAVVMLVVSVALPAELRVPLMVFALSFPLMACQDFARYIGISRYAPEYSIVLDVAWLVLFIACYMVLHHAGLTSLPWVFGAWSATGAAVGVYALWNHLPRGAVRDHLTFWYRSERSVGFRFAGQMLINTAWTYVVVYLFVLVFTFTVIGQFKLAQVIFGPITVMVAGVLTAMVALAARAFAVDPTRAVRFVFLGGAATAAVTLLWTLAVYEAPVHTMTKIFGSAWPAARHLVPAMGLALALQSMAAAASAGLRSMRAAKQSLRVAMCMVPILFVLCMGGAALWGVEAAVLALCVGYLIYVVAGWTVLIRTVRTYDPDASSGPVGEPEELLEVVPA